MVIHHLPLTQEEWVILMVDGELPIYLLPTPHGEWEIVIGNLPSSWDEYHVGNCDGKLTTVPGNELPIANS